MNPLSDAEKVDVRRFCGFPAFGAGPTGQQSWRYFQAYGLLEYRLVNLSIPELGVVRKYLGTLGTLEVAVPAVSGNLDTDQASMWTRNKAELADRFHLFDEWRRRLCGFLGLAPGPALSNGSSISLVI